jgi:hypothetical protein
MKKWIAALGACAALSALPTGAFAHGYDAGDAALGGFVGGVVSGLIGSGAAPVYVEPAPVVVTPAPVVVPAPAPVVVEPYPSLTARIDISRAVAGKPLIWLELSSDFRK